MSGRRLEYNLFDRQLALNDGHERNNNLAKIIKKSITFSKGCLVQMGALLLPFIGTMAGRAGTVIGTILMLVFVFVGGRMSTKWFCGNCREPIAGKSVSICPSCKAELRGVASRPRVSRRTR